MKRFNILGICGSLRENSINKNLLIKMGEFLPEEYELELADLSGVPLYNSDLETDLPASVAALASQVQKADAVLISSPEYNSSISGVLKNALDWLSRPIVHTPLSNKVVAIMGATPGALGTIRGQLHLREVLFALNAQVLRRPEVLIPHVSSKLDENGFLVEERALGLLNSLAGAIVEEVETGLMIAKK